jgi:phospholipid/cholesterol/gamma-HCH transport system substrate-binding protein
MATDRRTELRVGLFIAAAVVIGGALAFFIGEERSLFSSKTDFYAVFDDVAGLRAGSPVRVSGVSSGTVTSVRFRDGGGVQVDFDITADARDLIRQGSEARLGSKGLLGDRLIDIRPGEGDLLPEGSQIPTGPTEGLEAVLGQAGSIMADARGALRNVRTATEPFSEPELLTDRELSDRLDATLTNLSAASAELSRSARSVRVIADEVRTGDGTAHELIYGDEGSRLITNAADASAEVAQLLRAVREGDGTVHDLIYEDSGEEIIANLEEASEDLRLVMEDIRAGRGPIGGLLTDPSIYEDIKRLVGDLSRNEILRALVRYSIRRDESAEPQPAVEESDE